MRSTTSSSSLLADALRDSQQLDLIFKANSGNTTTTANKKRQHDLVAPLEDILKQLRVTIAHDSLKDMRVKLEQKMRSMQRLARENNAKRRRFFARTNTTTNKDSKKNAFGIFVASNSSLRTAVKQWLTDRATCITQYGHICVWDTHNVTDMSGLFKDDVAFNDAIGM